MAAHAALAVAQRTPLEAGVPAYRAGMRTINLLAIHCTATLEGRPFTLSAIRSMHIAQGWGDIGYHMLLGLNGEIWPGRPEAQAGAHIKGRNSNSLAVSYVGGIGANGKPKDTRTTAQKQALKDVLLRWREQHPSAVIRGHRDMSPDLNRDGIVTPNEWLKACPCFDVQEWCRSVGIDPK